jgi:hypothetical protein
LEYRCRIDDRIIFDCEQLLANDEKEKVFSDADLTPTYDGDYLKLCKIKFNVLSMIFPSANPHEVIQGWNNLGEYFQLDEVLKLDRITEIFMKEYQQKLTNFPTSMFCNIEPDIIYCIRLAYWYQVCLKYDRDNTFQYKKKDIKGKLRRRLLTNLEEFKSSYSYKNNEEIFEHLEQIPDGERVKKINEALPKAKTAKIVSDQTRREYDDLWYQWFKEVSSIIAELMFAALCAMNGYKISFVHHEDDEDGESHDYDFLINGVPMQVKAYVIYRSNKGRVNKHLEETKQIIRKWDDRTLNIEDIKNSIINFVRIDYLAQIRKAIEQKARFVFIDGTQSSTGFALNRWASDHDTDFSIQKSLAYAFTLCEPDSDFIPSIFAAGANDYTYRLSSICLRIPVVKIEHGFALDDWKLGSIDIISE